MYFVVLVFSSIFICSASVFIFRTVYSLWDSFEIFSRYAVQYVFMYACMHLKPSGSFPYKNVSVGPGKKSPKVSCCQIPCCLITY